MHLAIEETQIPKGCHFFDPPCICACFSEQFLQCELLYHAEGTSSVAVCYEVALISLAFVPTAAATQYADLSKSQE